MEKAFVKNAADEQQVKDAEGKVKRGRDRELDDLNYVLQSVQGRRFIWRMLSECKTFASIWDQSSRIHYSAGKQDVGHWLMAEITDADEMALFKMMKESKKELGNV